MRVRMKVGISGTRDGAAWPAIGECLDTDEREAAELIGAGYAEPGDDDATTVARPAAKKAGRRRGAAASPGDEGAAE